jgi:hypothetical protein
LCTWRIEGEMNPQAPGRTGLLAELWTGQVSADYRRFRFLRRTATVLSVLDAA